MAWLQKPRHGTLDGKYYFQSFRVQMRGFHLAHSEATFAVQAVEMWLHMWPKDVSGFTGGDTGFLELDV